MSAGEVYVMPVAPAQLGLWLLGELAPESAAYQVPLAVRLRGPLDADALDRALRRLGVRHEILRTTFTVVDGEVCQVIHPDPGYRQQRHDLRGFGAEAVDRCRRSCAERAGRPADLARGPLFQPVLYTLGHDDHVLLIGMHHIITDGWSVGVLWSEFAALYRAEIGGPADGLPELPVEYADFAVWHREWLADGVQEQQLDFWRAELADRDVVLDLPTDRPRPRTPSFAGDRVRRRVPADLIHRLRGAGTSTAFMALHAAFAVLLGRYSGQRELRIGVPSANRGHAGTQDLIGFFANTIVVRTELGPEITFTHLLEQVRERMAVALTHAEVPFGEVVRAVRGHRDDLHNPCFQVMVAMDTTPGGFDLADGVRAERFDVPVHTAKFDLTLFVAEDTDGAELTLEFSTDLFLPGTAERMLDQLVALCHALAVEPDQPVARAFALTGADRGRIELWSRGPRSAVSNSTLELFAQQVAARPHQPAVVDGGRVVDYAELDAIASRIAAALAEQGTGPGDVVGVRLSRSVELVAALLAVWKRGAAYLPLDPSQPDARLAAIEADARPGAVVTDAAQRPRITAGVPVVDVAALPEPAVGAPERALGALAYVLYTSGSTGRPKGVLVHHAGLANYVSWAADEYCPDTPPVAPLHTTVGFDLTVTSLWVPLCAGGTVRVVPEDAPVDGLIAALTGDPAPNLVKLTPAHLEALCRLLPPQRLADLTARFVVGGEVLTPCLVRRFFAVAPRARVVNEFGPTETVVGCSVESARLGDDLGERPGMSIGRPIANTNLYVLDEMLRPGPVGVPGELYVGGPGVGVGYLGDPQRTAAAFLPDPYSGEPGARMYGTGDRARYLPDGRLEFLGRRDEQAKIRGHRIELAEVEAAVRALPGVDEAVVRAVQGGDQARLVAYVVGDVDPAGARRALASRLPEVMVPSAVMRLDALPLTANGKVDRNALPVPRMGTERAPYVGPRTSRDRRLATLFAELLNADWVGLDDHFFDLGGHSLLATQLVTRIRAEFGVELPLSAVFERPTVRALGEIVGGGGGAELPPLERIDRSGEIPLSYAQHRMWVLQQLEPDSPAYNVPTALGLRGPLDVDRLRAALHAVGMRHEVLHTHFAERDGRPVATVGAQPRLQFEVVDLWGTRDGKRTALARAATLAREPFDLEHGPLVRAVVSRLSDTEHVLALSMHHIVSDGWSLGVLLRELEAAYAGVELPPLPVQYADFAAWQREWLDGGALQDQLDYWVTALEGAPLVLDLPTDHPRPGVPSYRGAHLRARLEPEVVQRLTDVARNAGTTLFTALHAAFASLLCRRSGQDEVVIGVPVANRSRLEIEYLIGFFVNTLPLRTRVRPDDTFEECVAQVGASALAAFEHQDVSFERMVEELAPARDLARNPVFQAMLVLQNATRATSGLGELGLERLPLEVSTAKFDLTLLVEDDGEPEVVLEYASDLFSADTAQAILDDYVRLCRRAAERPSARMHELTAVSTCERRRLLVEWNETGRGERLDGVVERVRHFAATTPHAIAVVDDHKAVTYHELACRASRVSRRLVGRGAGPDDLVLILGERGAPVITAVLGVLGAGAAYVPLDVRMPVARAAMIAADSGAPMLAATPAQLELARELVAATGRPIEIIVLDPASDPSGDLLAPPGAADDLAYVIYTSGSTGRPKGAMVHRAGMNNHLLAKVEDLELTSSDNVVQNANLTFDISVWQMLAALVVGGRTRVCGEDVALDALRLFELAAAEAVTVLEVVPSLLRAVLDAWDTLGAAPALPALRWLMVTGEVLPPDLCARWFTRYPGVPLVNAYGPTECSDDVTHAVLTPQSLTSAVRVPIGRAIRNTRLYVLDERLELVPVGVPGELYVGGTGVGRGYLTDPARTAAAFLPDPFSGEPGARLYRTGDLVRYLPDGRMEFLGRRDYQIKIRGQRVELGEIEACLRGVPAVVDAVVVAQKDAHGQDRLAGYVVGPVEQKAVHDELARLLPSAMLPSALVVLDALPLSANGKVDRAALPPADVDDTAHYVAPRTAEEKVLVTLFAEVLGLPRVGLDDDFFTLGGHSLLATQLVAKVRATFAVELPLRTLFERPRPRALAEAVVAAHHGAAFPARTAHRTGVATTWFPSRPAAPDARVQLFCLPHAGGGASAYREWGPRLVPEIEVVAVQLPGRETRFSEPAASSAGQIVEQLVEPVLARANKPFALFGHSMGALLSFELCHALSLRGHPPLHLFVSSFSSPHLQPHGDRIAHTLPDDEMAERVSALQGIPPEVLAAPEMLKVVLPVLRADLTVCETYDYLVRPPLQVPITALTGRDDPTVSIERVAAWSALSSGPVAFHQMPGDHFYLNAHLDDVLAVITRTLLEPEG